MQAVTVPDSRKRTILIFLPSFLRFTLRVITDCTQQNSVPSPKVMKVPRLWMFNWLNNYKQNTNEVSLFLVHSTYDHLTYKLSNLCHWRTIPGSFPPVSYQSRLKTAPPDCQCSSTVFAFCVSAAGIGGCRWWTLKKKITTGNIIMKSRSCSAQHLPVIWHQFVQTKHGVVLCVCVTMHQSYLQKLPDSSPGWRYSWLVENCLQCYEDKWDILCCSVFKTVLNSISVKGYYKEMKHRLQYLMYGGYLDPFFLWKKEYIS